jgi:hypothetical protein
MIALGLVVDTTRPNLITVMKSAQLLATKA